MSKKQIHLCPKCNCLTEHMYKGKVDNRSDREKELDKIATVATLGIYFLIDKAFLAETQKKYFKCTCCNCISIH